MLQNIQRVQFAPVDDAAGRGRRGRPPAAPQTPGLDEPALTDLASPVAATALAELYRQQELEVPILVPRDGPIAALDPDTHRASCRPGERPAPPLDAGRVPASLIQAAVRRRPRPRTGRGRGGRAAPKLIVVAERAAWIRVYLENGTVIFESILEKGETYSPPEGVDGAADLGRQLRARSTSGSAKRCAGRSAAAPRAAKDVPLDAGPRSPSSSRVVEDVPEVISQCLRRAAPADAGGRGRDPVTAAGPG